MTEKLIEQQFFLTKKSFKSLEFLVCTLYHILFVNNHINLEKKNVL